jgi:hypothetical protein
VLNRLKLAQKMFLLPILAGVAILVIFAAIQTSGARTARLVERIDDGYIPKIDLSRDLVETLAQIQRGLQDAAAAADPQILGETDQLKELFVTRLDDARNNPIIEASDIEQLQTSFNGYYELARDTTHRLITQETGDAVFAAIEQMRADYLAVKESLDDFAESARSEADLAVAGVKSSQTRARNLVLLVMLISGVVLGVLSYTVTEPSSDRLRKSSASPTRWRTATSPSASRSNPRMRSDRQAGRSTRHLQRWAPPSRRSPRTRGHSKEPLKN